MPSIDSRRTWIGKLASGVGLIVTLAIGFGASPSSAQGYNETMSALSAQSFYDDVQRRISAGTGGDDAPFYTSGYYPETPEQQAALEASERDTEIMRQLRADPRFERFVNGGWEYYQSRETAGPGEYCAATYLSRYGIITLTGHDKNWDGGMIMFSGVKIPRPATVQQVSASLTQTGDAPATVQAFIFAANPTMEELGTIGFAIPSFPDALRGMTDETEFVIAVDGQQIFRMSYKDGIKARNELRKCVRQR